MQGNYSVKYIKIDVSFKSIFGHYIVPKIFRITDVIANPLKALFSSDIMILISLQYNPLKSHFFLFLRKVWFHGSDHVPKSRTKNFLMQVNRVHCTLYFILEAYCGESLENLCYSVHICKLFQCYFSYCDVEIIGYVRPNAQCKLEG